MKMEFEIKEEWMYYALLYGKDAADEIMAEKRTTMAKSTRTGEKMVPVLYCDIDGTIRHGKDELGRFVNTADDVRVFDGVGPLLWEYKRLGWRIIGVSNQGGIALGYMDMGTCLAAMAETQKQTGYAFDKITWCSHHPDAKDPEMATCWCRKPMAGMVIETALVLSQQTGEIYPPHLGLFVGDRFEDNECARNAGLKFLNARDWRTGEHLALVKEWAGITQRQEEIRVKVEPISKSIARAVEQNLMTVDEAHEAMKDVKPLPDEALQRSLEITGAKVVYKPVSALEVNDEFVMEGVLYKVTTKDASWIKGTTEDGAYLGFYNPNVLTGESALHSWDTNVLTDDKDG